MSSVMVQCTAGCLSASQNPVSLPYPGVGDEEMRGGVCVCGKGAHSAVNKDYVTGPVS